MSNQHLKEHCGKSIPCSHSDVVLIKLSRCCPELVVNSLLLVESGLNRMTPVLVATLDIAKTGNEGMLTDRDHSACINFPRIREGRGCM